MAQQLQKKVNPGRLLILGYLTIILTGAILLFLPISSRHISIIDALYTSTSAVCVTGLIVKDTATDFTLFGKIIILLLIQIGGIGYMTLSTAFFFFAGQKLSLRDRLLMKESFSFFSYDNLKRFAFNIIRVTFIAEAIGAILLFIYFIRNNMAVKSAIGHSIFHSISAFCNAGLSTFSDNLTGFTQQPFVPLVISSLFILGGIGFIVISDVYKTYFRRVTPRLSLHSKTVITTTLVIIVISTIIILLVEWNYSLKDFSVFYKIMNAYFSAVSPRTAGFNTINFAIFHNSTLILVILLMFIGASSGGTGGGIKTSTFSVILMQFKALLIGQNEVLLFKRKVPQDQIFKSFLIVGLALSWLLTSLFFLLIFNNTTEHNLMTYIFELFSAFGTVGLSLGSKIAPNLSASYDFSILGKLVIIITMIIGRVGVLTLATALIEKQPMTYTHPEGVILVG